MKRRKKTEEPMTIAEAQAAGIHVPSVRRFGPGTAVDLGDATVIKTRWLGHVRVPLHSRARPKRTGSS